MFSACLSVCTCVLRACMRPSVPELMHSPTSLPSVRGLCNGRVSESPSVCPFDRQ